MDSFKRVLFLSIACVVAIPRANATTIVVTSSSTGANVASGCALRDAIQAVNLYAAVGACPAGAPGVNTINIGVDALAFSQVDSHSTAAVLPALVAGRSLNIFGKPQTRTALSYAPTSSNPCQTPASAIPAARLLEIRAGAALYVADVDLAGGCALDHGGAVDNEGQFDLVRSRLTQNLAYQNFGFGNPTYFPGGAIYNGPDAILTVTQATFDTNYGDGALYVDADPTVGYATVDHSTFVGSDGGAIDNAGSLEATNVTLYGNAGIPTGFLATLGVGGIRNRNQGYLDLSFATLLDNPNPQIQLDAGSTTRIKSTLFATPASASTANCSIDGSASITWSGVSISRDATCTGGSNLVSTDPKIDSAPASNGGTTQTLKLLSGSPALHADADCLDTTGTAVTDDQRGDARPASHCDAGAYEDTVFQNGLQ